MGLMEISEYCKTDVLYFEHQKQVDGPDERWLGRRMLGVVAAASYGVFSESRHGPARVVAPPVCFILRAAHNEH